MPQSPSTVDRPLRMRARADVIVAAVRVAGGDRWVVTDPITRRHFELSSEEHAVLAWLGDRRNRLSLRDLQRRFEQQFAPRRIEADELWRFLSRLHRNGLIVSAARGQGDELWRRRQDHQREERRWAWTKLLAIRLPSIDPNNFLDHAYGILGWAFRPWALAFAAAVVLVGATVAIANAAELARDLPSLAMLAEPRFLLWLAVTAVGVKAMHELGHALACKHFGGNVHEMGVILLAFAPCLYCDVSDMWRLPSRWKRMAVSAAGMAVELVMAAVAVVVWRLAEPGVVSSLAISVMIVCSIGTLLVNANPLLRYDGYYLLADVTNTSNLWQRSREALSQLVTGWLLRPTDWQPRRPRLALAAYGLASQVYVLLIVTTVLWLLMATLKPLRLESIAWALGAVSLAAVAAGPIRAAARWSRDPASMTRVRRGRATLTAIILAAAAAGLLRAPWTYTVTGDATTVVEDTQPLVATLGGSIVWAASPGQRVAAGDVVAELRNPAVEQELLELGAELAEQELRVEQLQAMRGRDQQARDSLPAERSLLDDLRTRRDQRRSDANRLRLTADRDGVVIAPPQFTPVDEASPSKLPTWTGSPLDRENTGAWIPPGTLVCLIGDPSRVAAQALLPEADVDRLRQGQMVRVALRQTPGVVLRGRVTEVADNATRPPTPTDAGPQINNWSPLQPPASAPTPLYRVQVALDPHQEQLRLGGIGRIKIDTGRSTLGQWLADGFRQTFRLP